jgi:gluconate 2-dehydrogenase gamma chain
MSNSLPRRGLLLGAAGTAASSVAAVTAIAATPPSPGEAAAASPPAPAAPEPMQVLNATEAGFMDAVADAMIPADALSPSGSDCGIVTFVDRRYAWRMPILRPLRALRL